MAEEEKHKRLDELLDSLLATYSDAEPRPGMKTRLLANLRARSLSRVRSQRRGWRWFLAGAGAVAFAAFLFAMYLSQVRELPPLPEIKAAGPPSLPVNATSQESGRQLRRLRIAREDGSASVGVAGVRQQVFPTPTPLSDQERLLLRYLAGTPREEVVAQSRIDEPAQGTEPLTPEMREFTGTDEQSIR